MRVSELERLSGREGEIVRARARVNGELRELALPSAIPDSDIDQNGLLHNFHAAESASSDGSSVSTLADVEGDSDLSGSGTWRDDVFGDFGAIELDGDTDEFSGSVPSLPNEEYAVAGLIKIKSLSGSNRVGREGVYYAGADGDGYSLETSNDEYTITHSAEFGEDQGSPTTSTELIFVATWDGSTITLDVNDSEELSASRSDIITPTSQITIGEFLETNEHLEMYLGQMAFWETHKDSAERSNIHDQIESNWELD